MFYFWYIQCYRENNSRFKKIKVVDTGIGVSDHDRKGLFQVFGMVHKYRDEFNMKGAGLGLTISQKLVKMLGGKIKMESVVGFGTTVTFTIKEKHSFSNDEESKISQRREETKIQCINRPNNVLIIFIYLNICIKSYF